MYLQRIKNYFTRQLTRVIFATSILRSERWKFQRVTDFLNQIKKEGIAPDFYHIETAGTEPEAIIEGKRCLVFCANNYLGLSKDPTVITQAQYGLSAHGLGPGGSRFLCGNIGLLEKLDREVARFVGKEDAITFPTGYMANLAVFKGLLDPLVAGFPYAKGAGVIFSDEYNHGSIIDGCRLSRAEKIVFKHNDTGDLEKKIQSAGKRIPRMIVTEGAFSVEGEVGNIREIAEISQKHKIPFMVDDAHGIGILGPSGRGAAALFGITDQVDIIMGSFDKAFGGMGGFLAGNHDLIEYLRIASKPYMLSSAIPGVMAAGMIEAIVLCESEEGESRRRKLFSNAEYLRTSLRHLGFSILGDDQLPTVPLFIGEEQKAISFARKLFEEYSIYCPSFRWPVAPRGKSRLRIVPMATHEKHHLNSLLEACDKLGRELTLI